MRAGTFKLGIIAAGLLTAVGCDTQRAVNRVQPAALEKAMFTGEFYFQQTVVDTPASAFTFVGEQGDTEVIHWEIQENFLIARRTYEFVAGSEQTGLNGTPNPGAAIAAYRISSHFDIRRDYNPVTGEEQNVISENSTDRPWYERQFMRVDWSKNLIEAGDFDYPSPLFASARYFEGLRVTEVGFFPTRGCNHTNAADNDTDCPRFERDATNNVNYMEVTTEMFAEPTMANLGDGFQLPMCALLNYMNGSNLDCTAQNVKVRSSYLRVDPTRDFQPMNYTGDRMERAGYFVSERSAHDPVFGNQDNLRYRFNNHHNLWQASHIRRGSTLATCVANDECSDFGEGSFCDLDLARANRTYKETCFVGSDEHECSATDCVDFDGNPTVCRTVATRTDRRLQGACTIPYRERQIRPVVYYASANLPPELFHATQNMGNEWNRAFVETIDSLRASECMDPTRSGTFTAANETRCRTDNATPEAERANKAFVICHSPVVAADPTACGARGTVARIGDLRYHLIGYVNEMADGPLGYGPVAADPRTGEIIRANAFIYGDAMSTLSTYAAEQIRLLTGDVTAADVASGATANAYINGTLTPGGIARDRDPMGAQAIDINAANFHQYADAMDFSNVPTSHQGAAAFGGASPAEFRENLNNVMSRVAGSGGLGRGVNVGTSRLQRLVGTDIERMMVGPEALMLAGMDPQTTVTPEVLNQVSPLRNGLLNPENLRRIERIRATMDSHQCRLQANFQDLGLEGLARAIRRAADTNGTIEWYGQRFPISNITTAGSPRRLNVDQLRRILIQPIYHGVTAHEVGHTLGLRHNFTGSADALNYEPGYWALRDDGSVGPRTGVNADAITEREIDGRIAEFQTSTVMDYGNNFVVTDGNGIGHYDHAAIKLGYGDLVEVFTNVPAANQRQVINRGEVNDYDLPIRLTDQGGLASPASTYHYTEWPSVVGGRANLERRADVRYDATAVQVRYTNGTTATLHWSDALNRPIVPYMFGSDENADINVFNNTRYDQGADVYEAVQSVVNSYWSGYVFSHFRRGRVGFSASGAARRSYARYFDKLQGTNQSYALWRGIIGEITDGQPVPDSFWETGTAASFTAASAATYSLFTRVIAAPEPGNYAAGTRVDGTPVMIRGSGTQNVDFFEGRALETQWDNTNQGFFWFRSIARAGYTYDKLYALIALADPTTHFINRDTSADVRQYQISYMTSFGPSVQNFFRGIVGEDWSGIAPRFQGDEVVYPTPTQIKDNNMAGSGLSAPITPNLSFTVQLIATVYGTALLPQTYDSDYLNRSRIFADGSIEALNIPPARILEFVDNQSGITYRAVRYMVDGREQGIGARMLQHAIDLQTANRTPELRQWIQNIDLQRRVTAIFGTGVQPLSP